MCDVVTRVSNILSIHPPENGGIDSKKLATNSPPVPPAGLSPHSSRRSFADQFGIDLFRSRSKDDLCPPLPPPPAVR